MPRRRPTGEGNKDGESGSTGAIPAMDGAAFTRARAELGKSQRELASILGVSLKAVESYEQGWRRVPEAIERMMYYLALRLRGMPSEGLRPCWALKGCREEPRAACLAWLAGEGAFCWFITGKTCASVTAAERRGAGDRYCFSCSIFLRLMRKAGMPRGFAAD